MRLPFDEDCTSGENSLAKAFLPKARNLRFKARKISRSTPYPRQTEMRA